MSKVDIQTALDFHNNNDFESAVVIYRSILESNPDDVDANNLLASAYASLAKNDLALFHSNIACSKTNSPDVFNNRARLLIKLKKFHEAISDLKYAIKMKPDFPEAENNLCVCYRALGDLKKSIAHGIRAYELNPNLSNVVTNLGLSYFEHGDYKKALDCFISISENYITSYRHYLAYCLYKCEDFEGAVTQSLLAFDDRPDDLDLLFISLDSMTRLRRLDKSSRVLLSYNSKHEFYPREFDNYLSQDIFFNAFQSAVNFIVNIENGSSIAIEIYNKTLASVDKVAHAIHVNLGVIYFNMGDLNSARLCNNNALICNNKQVWAYNNLGVICLAEKKSSEAIAHFEKALEVDPHFVTPLGWLLKEKSEICDWYNLDCLKSLLVNAIESGEKVNISGITMLANFDDNEFKLKCMKLNSSGKFANDGFEINALTSPRSDNKIRIAYYSYDFRDHPVAHLTNRLFMLHDRDTFEVYCYSYGPDDGSEIRESIKETVDVFRDLKNFSNHAIANVIKSDQIDILIDLTGDTNGNRSEVFKYDIAKIKAHWLGFIGTLGTDAYDFIIADEITIPIAEDRFYIEKVLRVDGTFHVCDDSRDYSKYTTSRANLELPEDKFIFGVCSQTFKIKPDIFNAWMEILESSKNSVLVVSEGPHGASENLIDIARKRNLVDRLFFLPRTHVGEYLARFKVYDMLLDTFPYTSGTVASDALFGGCPILTLYGRGMVSRMCSSILTNAGLSDLIAFSLEDYVAKAIHYSNNSSKTNELRSYLTSKAAAGDLLNTKKFVKNFEKVLQSVVD